MQTGSLPDPIDRARTVPLHAQLAEAIARQIVGGAWQAGRQLPPEPDLSRAYGLSRSTVRQALAQLERDGLIVRQKGRGTFVADGTTRSWQLQSARGFFQDEVERLGRQVSSTMLKLGREPLPDWAADALAQPHGAEGIVVERLRSVDGHVVLYVVNHLPVAFADGILDMRDGSASLYGVLRERHGIEVAGGRRELEAIAANAHVGALLGVPPGTALAFIESVSWDRERMPFDCYHAWVRTDRMTLDIEIAATGR